MHSYCFNETIFISLPQHIKKGEIRCAAKTSRTSPRTSFHIPDTRRRAITKMFITYPLSPSSLSLFSPLPSFWHFQVKSGLHFAPSERHKNCGDWRDFRHRLLGVLTTDQDSGWLAVWYRCDTTKTSKTLIVAQEIPLHEVKTVIFKGLVHPN